MERSEKSQCDIIFSAIADSVLEASDEEILEEIKEQGRDPQEIAETFDKIFQSEILKIEEL